MQQAENTENLKRLPEQFPHPLATEWGEDDFGLYQIFELFAVAHVFRWIPPGLFQMGSPEKEEGRRKNELLHWVNLTEGYWLGETAINQQQWKAVMDKNGGAIEEDHLPQVEISWDDCADFIEAVNKEYEGLGARLPTEAEWEYACRAGSETAFWWGDKLDLSKANYRGTWDFTSEADEGSLQHVCPVKSCGPNPWGLYQVHGNVWEWCWDRYSDYPAGNSQNPEGPQGEAVSEDHKIDGRARRVLRGGSWYNGGRYLRSAYRSRRWPDLRSADIGFRLVLGRELRGGGARASIADLLTTDESPEDLMASAESSELDLDVNESDTLMDEASIDSLGDSDETDTKLDLARAYIHMGDVAGAEDILDEVLEEGNNDQKKEAEMLLRD